MSPEMKEEKAPELTISRWLLGNAQAAFLELQTLKLPFDVRFQIKQIRSQFETPLKNYEETRQELIKELGEEIDGQIKIKPENMAEFKEKFAALVNQPINLQIEKIPESAFGDQLSLAQVDALSWMIQEGV